MRVSLVSLSIIRETLSLMGVTLASFESMKLFHSLSRMSVSMHAHIPGIAVTSTLDTFRFVCVRVLAHTAVIVLDLTPGPKRWGVHVCACV
jgi:hypothetical protein